MARGTLGAEVLSGLGVPWVLDFRVDQEGVRRSECRCMCVTLSLRACVRALCSHRTEQAQAYGCAQVMPGQMGTISRSRFYGRRLTIWSAGRGRILAAVTKRTIGHGDVSGPWAL